MSSSLYIHTLLSPLKSNPSNSNSDTLWVYLYMSSCHSLNRTLQKLSRLTSIDLVISALAPDLVGPFSHTLLSDRTLEPLCSQKFSVPPQRLFLFFSIFLLVLRSLLLHQYQTLDEESNNDTSPRFWFNRTQLLIFYSFISLVYIHRKSSSNRHLLSSLRPLNIFSKTKSKLHQ